MALGFLSSLFGCSQTTDHGAWTCLIVSNVSPDRRDFYSFRVNIAESGEMILYGYCNDEENEYRSDDGLVLMSRTADKLREMEIEKLPVKKAKRKFGWGITVDTVERVEQVTYEDGTELGIILSNEQRAEIISLLNGELIAAVSAEKHGEWNKLWLYFTNDNYSECYDFTVRMNDDGNWIALGYCSDDAYNRYESEDGIVLSAETVHAIQEQQLQRYPVVRKADPELDPELDEVLILDGSSRGLVLGYADGYTEEKAVAAEVNHSIAKLLKKEFAEKADLQ